MEKDVDARPEPGMTESMATDQNKNGMRAAALARRDALGDLARAAAAQRFAAFAGIFDIGPNIVVAGYMPMRNEADPLPLMRALAGRGARLALPAVVARWRDSRSPIVVARYLDGRGHPALFARAVFGELLALEGDQGARRVIEGSPNRVAFVDVAGPMPADVDTAEDLRTLSRSAPSM